MITSKQIAAIIIHDADGRIDRDFYFFYPRLIPGGAIIIDDYSDKNVYRPYSPARPSGVSKKIFCYRLLNQFIEWGLFVKSFIAGSTILGQKPVTADFTKFNLEKCQKIIDKIIAQRRKGLFVD